jgi:hypothetical protein
MRPHDPYEAEQYPTREVPRIPPGPKGPGPGPGPVMRPRDPYEAEWYSTQKMRQIPPEPKRRDPRWFQALTALASVAAIIGLLVTLGIIHPFGSRAGPSPQATVTVNPLASYATATPGYGCDHGGGSWSHDQIAGTSWSCSAKGLVLTQGPSAAGTEAEVTFHWPGHTFATNYSLHVTMSHIAPAIACGGIGFRGLDLKDYEFDMCADGTWQLTQADEVGTVTVTQQGMLSDATQPYDVKLTVIYSTVSVQVNGQSLPDMMIDPSYLVTHGLNLDCDPHTSTFSQPNTATFTDFVYAPLA